MKNVRYEVYDGSGVHAGRVCVSIKMDYGMDYANFERMAHKELLAQGIAHDIDSAEVMRADDGAVVSFKRK